MNGFRMPKPSLPVALPLLSISVILLLLTQSFNLADLSTKVGGLPLSLLVSVGAFVCVLVILFTVYAYALYCVHESTSQWLYILIPLFTIALMVPLIANPNLLSNDVYSYIFYGRMQGVYGLNPYSVPPAATPGDPFLPYVDWRDMLTPYGPLWTTWSTVLSTLVPGGIIPHLLAFKICASILHLANIVLIGKVVSKVSPSHTTVAMAAYAWNPLALFEFAGNAHNESMMLTWILLSMLALVNSRLSLAFALLALAVSTKFTAMLFAPFYVVLYARRYSDKLELAKHLVQAVLLGTAIWIIFWLPYLSGNGWRQMISLPEPTNWYMNSLPATAFSIVKNAIISATSLPPYKAAGVADMIISVISISAVMLIGLKLAGSLLRNGKFSETCFWFAFAYIVIAGSYFQPWYVTTLFPFAVLSRKPLIYLAAGALSLSAMFMYSCVDCHTYVPNRTDFSAVGLVVFLLPLIIMGAYACSGNRYKTLLQRVSEIG